MLIRLKYHRPVPNTRNTHPAVDDTQFPNKSRLIAFILFLFFMPIHLLLNPVYDGYNTDNQSNCPYQVLYNPVG